ncbi:MAG: hypothetical protein HQK61_05040, partial [Desulfamplus sp.]|nr:hypothetical protein [Desulfamplus sp.]
DLFKPSGQLPLINKAIKRFKELQKEVKAASLSSREWKEHQKAVENAEAQRAGLEKERDRKNKDLYRIERLERAIPELASLNSWKSRLLALGEVVLLPPDFSQKHQKCSYKTAEAMLNLKRDTDQQLKLEEKIKAISFNKELLNHAQMVDDFHQRLGEYRKGQKDRPERNGMRISLKRDAGALLDQIRPDLTLDDVETLRPMLARARLMQQLSPKHEAINQQIELAQKQIRSADHEIRDIEKSLETMPQTKDPKNLLQALRLAQKIGDIDQHIENNRGAVELNKKTCLSELKRIGLWSGDLPGLMEIALPLAETVQQFDRDYSTLSDERRELEKDRKNIEKELKTVLAEIKKAEYAGEVPSEEDLDHTREKRQQGWQLLRRQWIDKQDVARESKNYDSGKPLHDAYEDYVQEADIIADRLRREADRVAHAASFRARAETLQDALAENGKGKNMFDLKEQKLDQSWLRVWEPVGITPLSPKEMSSWLSQMDKLRFKVGDIFKKEQDIELDAKRRKELRQAIEKELDLLGEHKPLGSEELGPLLITAQSITERIADQKKESEKLKEREQNAKKAFQRAEEELEDARDALLKWQEQWKKAVSGLGLKDEVSTFEALDLIETLKSCFDKLKEADDLKKRIAGIDRDAEKLEAEFKSLLDKVAPEMLNLPLEQAILQLRHMLGNAQKDSALHDKLSEELESIQKDVSVARQTLNSANGQMNELLRIARCKNPEDLTAVIARFTEYQRLQERISSSEATLAKIGAGATIEELSEQASELNADELPGRTESLRKDIDGRINPEINRISQIIGEEKNKLSAMDGSAGAAEIADRMEQELARIRRLASRYAQIRIASRILQREIERYREEHQDPVLKIASGYFSNLTLGSFVSLRTDVDDKGEPVLVGTRPDGIRLTVDKMSSGTRDQLYLALRIATIEWRLQTREPMPFIVDDILINFDDDRSRATLNVLSDLSRKNQVILFTHHRQIIEDVKNIKTDAAIQIHELG